MSDAIVFTACEHVRHICLHTWVHCFLKRDVFLLQQVTLGSVSLDSLGANPNQAPLPVLLDHTHKDAAPRSVR